MKKILIIDDEEMIRRFLERELSGAGYAVLSAENGKRGIQVALEQSPDLILLDIMMPEMGGGEAISFLKKDPRTKNTPVIFVTSMVKGEDVHEGFVQGSKGVDQYFIAKPIDGKEVLRFVRASIGEP